ncbi:MFS transporter [Sinomicrobium weinanense]|uniref:MFS transporter n=1 Tax=Sinomicrobium weinanense TaxID=2842200 RepID=A0A926Q4Y8_9FLAO|nr:MFS transporter [Sinomicrobium weinanense]MBC9798504.1 MFS transporter [Sinomicrobium weinanense]MBU3122491.1 MFS transporter [Sinomicrobium weinanense]
MSQFAFSSPVYNFRFGLVCLSSLLFSSSYNMLIPELPAYLSRLGGAEYKGLIISLFTLTAGLSRPFSGRLTDTIGRIPVMIAGGIVCLVCGLFYPVLGSVSGFLFLRLVHGFSTGFNPTATAAYVADIIPRERWGEALGLQGLCFSLGFALGPAIGSLVKLHYSFDILFYTSSVFALLSVVILVNMKETLGHKQNFNPGLLRITKRDIIAPEVLPAAMITFFSYVAFGIILTLIPDWSEHLGISNKGAFFIAFTISSLTVRIIAGKVSDKVGRPPVIYVGLVFLFVALLLIGYSGSFAGLMTGSAVYGMAMGILPPTLNAWTIDMSLEGQRGRALATRYIALEAGIGLGAFFSGWYYSDIINRIPAIMYTAAVIPLIALGYMWYLRYRRAEVKHR